MSLSISIQPVSRYLDMYGEPDATSAYSLAGVVTIAVSSPYSLFERRRTARLLLQSLSITFEGQSEVFTQATGYTGLRLCSVTKELVPSDPIEFTNEGHEEDAEPCKWDVLFNLPIPGWLPSSTTLGMDEIGIRYGLYATAKFVNLDLEQNPSSWSFATLCAPFRSRVRSVESSKNITVRRYVLPPHVDRPTSAINYLVNSQSSSEKDSPKKRIPSEVLSKIQVLASVPESVDIEDCFIPITVRLRTKDLDGVECKRLQVTDIGINIIQQERCRYRPSSTFLNRHPLPPREQQPPNLPLRDPHPISSIYESGLYFNKDHSESVCRTFSLLPEKESGKYKLADNNYAFATDAEQGDSPTWYTMETRIPFVQMSSATVDSIAEEWGAAYIRPSSSSPLFSVAHDVTISLTFSYDLPDSDERARERLNFNIPLSFGKYLQPSSTETALKPADSTTMAALGESPVRAPPSSTSFSNLPSYSQLYDQNGDRRIDMSIPLPRYTPQDDGSTPEDGALETSVSSPQYMEEKPATPFLSGADETEPLFAQSS
ncbi:hypothetical protein D9611_004865 [Ephemerocybe angulata]|uniref:Uncharacterized protein n=1 Tax=Ephemerocybe angulata TaxID=980116 RepID=A0A8H5B3D0_9AGAR|nr:hypothetical protein D9611_004865 [Tulosesus angulatus]